MFPFTARAYCEKVLEVTEFYIVLALLKMNPHGSGSLSVCAYIFLIYRGYNILILYMTTIKYNKKYSFYMDIFLTIRVFFLIFIKK